MEKKYIKVVFEVENEEDDEVIKESIWAIDLGDNTCQIDNIPFYAFYYACDDIVSIEEFSEQLYVKELITASGNSTVRLLFENEEELTEIKSELNSLSLESESSMSSKLLAVNIPKKILYSEIKNYLENGETKGKFQYEEACISEKHQEDL